MNQQEIFNTVATHLFKQGERALDENGGSCMYRGHNGTMCAVGCLIPDEMYSEEMEWKAVLDLVIERERKGYELPDYITDESNLCLLQDLQKVHDDNKFDHSSAESTLSWKSTDNMRQRLTDVAIRHALDYSILNTLKFENR